jgi:hypothetical protein
MSWEDYMHKRFVYSYLHYLRQCDTLVIAFDNYAYVPPAKCMTQATRRKHIPAIPFSETSPLPCMVPEGEYWTQAISNRTFKNKVIEYVCLKLPKLLLARCENPSRKTIIIDYDIPEVFRINPDTDKVCVNQLSELPPLGEADIKFPRWAAKYPKLLVDSIDGDSVPIALIQHETMLQQDQPPPRVCIYRMKIKLADDAPPKDAKKRKPTDPPKKRPAREYEYVDVHMLYQGLLTSIRQATSPVKYPTHERHEMRMITTMILLTGSDFTRNLPQLGARTLWENIVDLWFPLTLAYQPGSSQLNPTMALSMLVTNMYKIKFEKHIGRDCVDYASVARNLLSSSLCKRVKDSIASPERVSATIRNCNWVLLYWTCDPTHPPPSPISEDFGYKQDRNGKTEYIDLH